MYSYVGTSKRNFALIKFDNLKYKYARTRIQGKIANSAALQARLLKNTQVRIYSA